ncbi:MAG: winged helix-turn-helix domain-containing protein [Hyphomicrobiales bacterium]|nr:winged helix-turn-helix domain-containing protein [Hyphomicrobiales bacterium]
MKEWRTLVDDASDAALAIDGKSRVVAWNDRASGLLGYTRREALDQPCSKILQAVLPNGELLCTPTCEGKRCFEQHMPFGVSDCCLRHKDGWWLRATISTLIAPAPSNGKATADVRAIVLLRPREVALNTGPADGRLRVFTFGRFDLNANGRALSVDRWYRRHALTLLKILVTDRREALHREQLVACLWPNADERRGRERLKVATYFLREQLRSAGISGNIVTVVGSTYALNNESVWLDCDWFDKLYDEGRRLARSGRRQEALVCFEKAAQLYRGDYLPEDLYAEWCAEERERLRESYFDVLGHIIDGHLERGNNEEAAVVCRRGLVHEPCREGFHRALMICLARLGQRDRLIAHYDHCRKVLKAELGVGPTPETERLYRQLSSSAATDR